MKQGYERRGMSEKAVLMSQESEALRKGKRSLESKNQINFNHFLFSLFSCASICP